LYSLCRPDAVDSGAFHECDAGPESAVPGHHFGDSYVVRRPDVADTEGAGYGCYLGDSNDVRMPGIVYFGVLHWHDSDTQGRECLHRLGDSYVVCRCHIADVGVVHEHAADTVARPVEFAQTPYCDEINHGVEDVRNAGSHMPLDLQRKTVKSSNC